MDAMLPCHEKRMARGKYEGGTNPASGITCMYGGRRFGPVDGPPLVHHVKYRKCLACGYSGMTWFDNAAGASIVSCACEGFQDAGFAPIADGAFWNTSGNS